LVDFVFDFGEDFFFCVSVVEGTAVNKLIKHESNKKVNHKSPCPSAHISTDLS
jgi:hypothetical protein